MSEKYGLKSTAKVTQTKLSRGIYTQLFFKYYQNIFHRTEVFWAFRV